MVVSTATGLQCSPFIRLHPVGSKEGRCAIAVKEEKIEMEGEITESLRNRMFRLKLDNGHEMIGYTAGRMKRHRIRMGPGDRVRVEVSSYDLDRGRIVYRLR